MGAMTAPLFEPQGDGSVLFWPLGWWSRRARRLTGQEQQALVKASVRRFYIASIVIAGALGAILESRLGLWQFLGLAVPGAGAAWLAAYWAWVGRLTAGCETVNKSLSFREYHRRQAQALGRRRTRLSAVANMGLLLAFGLISLSASGLWLEGTLPIELDPGWAFLGLVVFGGAVGLHVWQLYMLYMSAGSS